MNAAYIIEATITAILLYWVLTNVGAFNQIIGAAGSGLTASAKQLWGGGKNPGVG